MFQWQQSLVSVLKGIGQTNPVSGCIKTYPNDSCIPLLFVSSSNRVGLFPLTAKHHDAIGPRQVQLVWSEMNLIRVGRTVAIFYTAEFFTLWVLSEALYWYHFKVLVLFFFKYQAISNSEPAHTITGPVLKMQQSLHLIVLLWQITCQHYSLYSHYTLLALANGKISNTIAVSS